MSLNPEQNHALSCVKKGHTLLICCFAGTGKSYFLEEIVEHSEMKRRQFILRALQEETPIRDPGNGEVKIQMDSVGICGTDLHLFNDGELGSLKRVETPTVIGHEGSGVIADVGEGVRHLKVGDKVTIEPIMPCRVCPYCTEGRYNLCPSLEICGLPGTDGLLRRFHNHPANLVYRLPENVSLQEGAVMEPLSAAVHACSRARIAFGHRVLVCGAGTIGLLCMLTAKAFGATKICITDTSELRLEKARQLGADCTILIKDEESLDVATKVQEVLGEQPHVSIECSGAASAMAQAVYATRSGGRVTVVGLPSPELIPTPICNAGIREVDIICIFATPNCFPKALELVSSGRVDVKHLITHRYKLIDIQEALETVMQRSGIKVMINCKKEDD